MDALLEAYLADRSIENRNALVEKLMPLVEPATRRYDMRLHDDLLQHGFLCLLTAVESFDPQRGMSLKTYVRNSIRFRLLDFVQSEAKHWTGREDVDTQQHDNAAMRLSEAMEESEVRAMCHGLKPKSVDVLVMLYARNMATQEIASALGMSKSRVSLRHQKALKHLRHWYASHPSST